jgi:putative flippase GtrA
VLIVKSAVTRLLADERVRFVLVGGVNTVLGYALFALFDQNHPEVLRSLLSLYGSYLISIVVAFILHRRFTFRVAGTGRLWVDLARFASVYAVSLAVNTVVLPVLIKWGGLAPLLAQALIVVVTTLISYFGHKYFSFRRTKRAAAPTPSGELR